MNRKQENFELYHKKNKVHDNQVCLDYGKKTILFLIVTSLKKSEKIPNDKRRLRNEKRSFKKESKVS